MSAICLILNAPDIEGAIRQVEENRQYINLAELRVDLLKPSERARAAEVPGRVQIPLILTIRLAEDGGRWGMNSENEAERIHLFLTLLNSAPWSFVDLEGNRPLPEVRRAAEAIGAEVIRSIHDFSDCLLSGPVPTLAKLISKLGAEGGIPKVAANCTDSVALLNLARASLATESRDRKILIAMGEYGSPSRILSQRHGSLWTYASTVKSGVAELEMGQLQPRTLEEIYRFREIDSSTPLFAVVGDPIAHSKSPIIHNQWLRNLEMKGTYIPIRTDNLAATLETCDIWGISGLSVTTPHKGRALSLADFAGSLTKEIGSANTLIKIPGGWKAENTDAEGFLQSLKDAIGSEKKLLGRRALIIGSGGSARAVAHALCSIGMKLIILNRGIKKARSLAEKYEAEWAPLDKTALPKLTSGVFLAVQTTSLGMPPNERIDPIPWWNPAGCPFVYDVVYGPSETPFLRRARASGCKTISGLAMLEAQAGLQFRLFTGFAPPKE